MRVESHTQDEYITEADMARRLLSNLRLPITQYTPTAIKEVWRQAESESNLTLRPITPTQTLRIIGSLESLQFQRLVSSVVRHVKGSERSLSQRINCYASNAGTNNNSLEAATLRGRLADSQCYCWGSESVVVGGVTTTQGERESRSQGKGTQTQSVSQNSETYSSRLYQRKR